MTVSPNHSSCHATVAQNLTQVRMYRASSDHRSGFSPDGWGDSTLWGLGLSYITPELQYLSVLGELSDTTVWCLLKEVTAITKLKYLDITDEQSPDSFSHERPVDEGWDSMLATQPSDRLAYIKDLARNHLLHEKRSELASEAFEQCANLRRICFVRSCTGEVYLRGYPEAVADSTGYVSPDINEADLVEIPERWHHGVPQTGLVPFPTFTPWEGIEEAED